MTFSIGVLELPHRHGAVAAQVALVEQALAKRPDVDLVLLPELALTGYVSTDGDFDMTALAEPRDGPLMHSGARLARRAGVEIVWPYVEQAADGLWNSLAWFDAQGSLVAHFRKRHPWYPETWASEHREPSPVVTRFGLRFVAAICFDVHFLADEWREPADVLLFPSAWVEEVDTRRVMLPEIARRHHAWVVNANWGAGEPAVLGQGDSLIVAPDGRIVASAASAGWISAELSVPPRG